MSDVTRALLLPDLAIPSDSALKSLVLYWDEVVVPDSVFRWHPAIRTEELEEPPRRSEETMALEAAGVVVRASADIAAESLMPNPRLPNEDTDGDLFLRVEKGDDDRWRFTESIKVAQERVDKGEGRPPAPSQGEKKSEWSWHEPAATLFADTLMARAQQARRLAASNHLAPVSPSLLSHLAALSDEEDGCPIAEASLISVALNAFSVRADTPVEAILEFRDRHSRSIQRFRGAMTDLAASLDQGEASPEAALAAARDVYRNRVEPDLGDLEERLNESNIKFLTRSLFGAASLAVTPLTAPTVVERAAHLGAQTINYRFSRQRLLDEHPYSYLHRLSTADFISPTNMIGPDLVSSELSPKEAVYKQMDEYFDPGDQSSDIPRYKFVKGSESPGMTGR